jgi:hypothetical protein
MRMARLNVAHLRRGGRNSLDLSVLALDMDLTRRSLFTDDNEKRLCTGAYSGEREKRKRRGHHLIM